jgi:hypothetical protein
MDYECPYCEFETNAPVELFDHLWKGELKLKTLVSDGDVELKKG